MKYISFLFIFIGLTFIGSEGLMAAPVVTNITGQFKNGNSITITGSNFGTKVNAGPLISSYNNATSANNWSTGSLGGNWTSSGTIALTNSSPLRSALLQSSRKISYNTNGSYATVRFNHPVVEPKIYVSFWVYRDYSSWDISVGSGGNNKFLRVYENASGTGGDMIVGTVADASGNIGSLKIGGESDLHTPTIAATAMNANFYSSAWYDVRASQSNVNMQLGVWEHYELYLQYPMTLGSGTGTGILWKDGKLHSRTINAPMNYSTGSPDRRLILLGLVSGARTSSGNEYIDQVYIDNTIAHVFITDSSTYIYTDTMSNHHTEIQVPSAWSDTSITCTLNQGSFADGGTVYLYVVDANGNISDQDTATTGAQGYPITIVSSGDSSGLVPPGPPNVHDPDESN